MQWMPFIRCSRAFSLLSPSGAEAMACMSPLRIPGLELILPTPTNSSSHCLLLKNMAWGWVYRSAIRSSRIMAVEFGPRRPSAEARSFNLNCRSILPRSQVREGSYGSDPDLSRCLRHDRFTPGRWGNRPASLWIAEDFWVLRFRLMVKRGPWSRPQASEGEAQHGPFCWTGRFGQGDECLHCG